MEQKRIVFILGSMNRGGAERVISILSRKYAEKGWRTDICTLLSCSVEYELDGSTAVHDFTGGNKSRIRRLPYWLKSIRSFVREAKPDVIVSFVAKINIIVQLACLGLKEKIIVSERNDPRYDGRGALTVLLTHLLYPSASAVVLQTECAKAYFAESVQRNSAVIPNPIEVGVLASEPDVNKIVAVGRLEPQKNHSMLIRAFAGVLREYPEKRLAIYGEGILRKELEAEISTLGISNSVSLEGNIPDIHERIKDAAFFVLPSDFEGLSNALLEAMAMGLPCISTNCAGSGEYIVNGENGLLTDVGDEEALYMAMLRFIEDDELRTECGKNAKKVSERVSTDVVMQQWDEIIG